MHPALVLWAFLAAATPPPGLAELQASARKIGELKLEEKGEVKVDAVRRRLGALTALAGAARPLLRGDDLPTRLRAHLAIAEAEESFARELFSAKAPAAARDAAARSAWAEQGATTVERALEAARAHLRSCVDLAGTDREMAERCGQALKRVGEGARAPAGQPAAIAAARMGELQACFDARAAERTSEPALEITARLSLDASGAVDSVSLTPRREDAQALYDCLSDGLWLWTFPGVADVELELPVRLKGPARPR